MKAIADKETIGWNEMLVGLPKRRIDYMFSHVDELDNRLRVWDAMLRAKNRLQLADNIPVLLITERGVRVYTAAEREEDLKASKQHEVTVPLRQIHASSAAHDFSHRSRQPRKPLSLFSEHSEAAQLPQYLSATESKLKI
jgi:hypothetical protein